MSMRPSHANRTDQVRLVAAGALVALMLPAVPARAGVVEDTCAICHGLDGVSHSDRIPSLAGQPRAYLLSQLRDFHDGKRCNDDDMMRPTAQQLTPTEMATAADYFSALPAPAGDAAQRVDAVAQRIYRDGDSSTGTPPCAACHGDAGQGSAVVPRLAGQRPGYLARQLDDYASGRRNGRDAAVMRAIASGLNPALRQRLATYVSSLQKS